MTPPDCLRFQPLKLLTSLIVLVIALAGSSLVLSSQNNSGHDDWAPYAEDSYRGYRSREDIDERDFMRYIDNSRLQHYFRYCHPGFSFRDEEDWDYAEYMEHIGKRCMAVIDDLNRSSNDNLVDFDADYLGLATVLLNYQPQLRSQPLTLTVVPSFRSGVEELIAVARDLASDHNVIIAVKEHGGSPLHLLDPARVKLDKPLSLKVPPANMAAILDAEFRKASWYYWSSYAFIYRAWGEEQRAREFSRLIKLVNLLHPLADHCESTFVNAAFSNRLRDALSLKRMVTYYMPNVLEQSHQVIHGLQNQERDLMKWAGSRLWALGYRGILFKHQEKLNNPMAVPDLETFP